MPDGTYRLTQFVDSTNRISESNETNNKSYRTITVGNGGSPEVDVTFGGQNIFDDDTSTSLIGGTNFGDVIQGQTSVTHTFTVRNDGNATLTLGNVTVPTGFNITEGLVNTIAPGSCHTFSVQLDTATAGTKSGQISFPTNDSDENFFNFSIRGVVNASPTSPEVAVRFGNENVADNDTTPSANEGTDFGSVGQGAGTVTRTFTVRNDGTATLTLDNVTVPTGFTITEGLTATLAPGSSDTFSVRLDTAIVGTKTGQIGFSTNDSDENPFSFDVIGVVADTNNDGPSQRIESDAVTKATIANGILEVPVLYSTVNSTGSAVALQATLLDVNLHFDSSRLEFLGFAPGSEFVEGRIVAATKSESAVDGNDGEASTNTVLQTLFSNALRGELGWPEVASTKPLVLYVARFRVADFDGTTSINFSANQSATVIGQPAAFAFQSQSLTVNVEPDTNPSDVPGFTIGETGGKTEVSDSGAEDTFTVVLTAAPASNVVLDVLSSDTGEVLVATPQLTFTPANWNKPQTVTVRGVKDGVTDGTKIRNVTVSVNAAASDDTYDKLQPKLIPVTARDPGVVVIATREVTEKGTTATFPLVLAARPVTNVVLLLESSDLGEVTVKPLTIVFTPDNWDTRQFVTLTGVDDDIADGPQMSIITISVDGPNSDDSFDNLPVQIVEVTTFDDETGASISGSVYADVNNNGRRDPGESGIANVEVRLSGLDKPALTDTNGNYAFLNLTAGDYTITETHPLAYIDGTDTLGTGGGVAGNDVFQVTIQGLAQLEDYNFGERGLQAQFINLNQFLSRPPGLDKASLPANAEGEASAVSFRSSGNGQVTIRAEGEATLELFDATMNSVARSVGGVLSTSVYKGEGYVLYVSSGGAATELHAASSVDLVTGAIALHNRGLTTDVNFDGSTSPVDALIIINHLNAPGSGFATPTFADVSGDRIVSPIDVLQIINLLNSNSVTVSAEGEAEGTPVVKPLAVPPGAGAVDFAPAITRPNPTATSRNVEDAIAVIAPQPYPSDATNELHTRLFARSTDDTDFTHNDLESAIDSIADDLAELWQ